MATQVQFRRGTTAQNNSFTGALGEVTVDTDKDTLVVHDGGTAGGFEISRADASNLKFPDGSVGSPAISFASDTNTGIYRGGTDILKFVTAGTDAITIDASQDVTLAGAMTGTTVTLSTSDNNPQLTITSTDADANAGPEAVFDRNSSSPADADRIGKLTFKGRNDANQVVEYGNIQSRIIDASDGTEDGRIIIQNIIAGDVAGVMESNGAETVFNENSKDLDFRVESDGNANAFFLEGSTGNVGIGETAPLGTLHVRTSDASITSVNTNSDDLIIENNGNCGISIASSTTGEGMVSFIDSGDTNIGRIQYQHSTNEMNFRVNDAERMRIRSDGRVGVNTSNADAEMHIEPKSGATNASIILSNDGRTQYFRIQNSETDDALTVNANDTTERMRITSAGAMTMGTTSSLTAASGITLKNDVQSGYPTLLFLQNQPGTGGTMGADIHMGYASDYGSILRFYGNPFSKRQGGFEFRRVTGSGTSDLSMRINDDGNVGIGDSSNIARLMVESNFTSYTGVNVKNNHSVATGVFINFTNSSGTQAGSISHNGTTTVAYNTSSDHRLKENVTADWDATTRLKQLNPVRFNFISDADTTVDGFLAHEVQSVIPEAITGTHNEVDADGNPVYQGIDQSKLVPLLVKTIQELEARITALETA